jgi:hypothetical protein
MFALPQTNLKNGLKDDVDERVAFRISLAGDRAGVQNKRAEVSFRPFELRPPGNEHWLRRSPGSSLS